MSQAPDGRRPLSLDVHGVKVRFNCHLADALPLLEQDYGRFVVPEATGEAFDLEVTSIPREAANGVDGYVDGTGNSLIRSTADSITVACSHTRAAPAYFSEIRPYLTSVISRHLIRTRKTFMIHASGTASHEGAATLYVGEAGAGKTTTALTQLSNGDSYVSNDLVFLSADNDGARVLAMPQPPMVGVGAAVALQNRFPQMASDQSDGAAGMSAQELLRYMPREKVSIDPRTLAPAALKTNLRFIVFPQPDFDLAAPKIEPVGATEAALRLLQQVIFPLKPGLPLPSTHGALIEDLMSVIDHAIKAAEAYSFRWCSDASSNASALKTLLSGRAA